MNMNMQIMDRKWKSGHIEIAPNCPRCSSSNTKFCYYNNYSLSQPRYFCKACRRYWTKGGSLRNVPVGGGCRKSRRSKSNRSLIHRTSSISSPTGDSTGDSSSNSDIDLAVVFANFLNQDQQPSSNSDQASDEFFSATTNSDSDTPATEFQPPVNNSDDMIVGVSDLLIQELEFPHEFGLQSLLGDELVQDALWSTDHSNDHVTTTWQPDEFDSLIGAGDDQLKIPANLSMIENVWSSFDLSGF